MVREPENSAHGSRLYLSLRVLSMVLVLAAAGFLAAGEKDSPGVNTRAAKPYRLPFGNNPFLPSQAKTETSGFIDASAFPSAAYCGKCHEDVHRQWRESAHANSFRAPFYKKNVDMLIHQSGIEFTRHCEGCHNPIALVSGALTSNSSADRSFDEDGITCMVCHSIQKVQNTSGTGSYVMGMPAVMVAVDGTPVQGKPSFDQILQHPELHRRAVMRDFYRTPEFCSVCHKAAIPKMLNDYKWLRAFSVYDEWQQTSWSRQSPLPFYKKDTTSTCQTCHMPKMASVDDYGAKNHQIASHRWPGANSAIPFFYGYTEQSQAIADFLRDSLSVDIFAISKRESGKQRLIAPLDRQNFTLLAGETVTVEVVIQNKKIGHNLVPEQRDFYESWVEFTATDSAGNEFFHSGGLDSNGCVDDQAHTYTNRLVAKDGSLLDLHQVWNTKAKTYDNTIPSGQSDLVRFRFRVPTTAQGPITLAAKVNYRRFRKRFTDFILEKSTEYPVLQLGSKAVSLKIGKTEETWPTAGKNEMLRWNNYGIALLRQQQYWKAADAFEKAVEINPSYVDGYINLAIAHYARLVDTRVDVDGPGNMSLANSSYQDYETTLQFLGKALTKDPANIRALFYRGLIYRLQNRLEDADRDLETVLKAYPRFRQARQELGYSYYLQKKLSRSRGQFEALQTINPDDLTAHYYLSLIYKALQMPKEAAREAALYAEHRDDQGAALLGLYWRNSHPDVAHENEPYHVHDEHERQTGMESRNK